MSDSPAAGNIGSMMWPVQRVAVVILIVLTVLRIGAAIAIAPSVVADAQGYDASAIRILKTGTFAYPLYTSGAWETVNGRLIVSDAGRAALLAAPRNAYTMPGYPAFLAALWALSGAGPRRWLVARIAQAVLSVLTAGLIFLLGRRFSERVGLWALIFAALYPSFTLANSYLLTEVLYTFLVTAMVWAALLWTDRRTLPMAAVTGSLFALALLVRPTHALWIVFACAAVLVVRHREFRSVLGQVVVMALVAAMVMAPWWIRNYQMYGRVVAFTTSADVNGPEAIRRDVAEQSPLPWESIQPVPPAEDAKIAALAAGVVNRAPDAKSSDAPLIDYYRTASHALTVNVLREYPVVFLKARLRSTFNAVLTPFAVSRATARGLVFLLSFLVHAALLVLFVLGATRLPRRLDAVLLASVPIYFLTLHAILIPINRYLFPAAPCVVAIAAFGLASVWRGRKNPKNDEADSPGAGSRVGAAAL